MIHAYDELYLDLAQRNLGDAFDFAETNRLSDTLL